MYVCICNALSESRIRESTSAGAASVEEVYDLLGVRPQCGKCIPLIRDMVRQTSARAAPER